MDNKIILQETQKVLREKFKGKVTKVILYGSRSRGDYKEYSDYDILIITKTEIGWKEEREISEVIYDIELKYEIIIDSQFISEDELKTIKGRQPFILNAFKEGVEA